MAGKLPVLFGHSGGKADIFKKIALQKTFLRGTAPLTPALPPKGGGGISDAFVLSAQETSIFFIFVLQVIRHYRNRGMPERRGL